MKAFFWSIILLLSFQNYLKAQAIEDEFATLKREILCKSFKFLLAEMYGEQDLAKKINCNHLDSIGSKIPKGYQEATRLWKTFKQNTYAGYGRKTIARCNKLIKDLNTEFGKISRRQEWQENLMAFQVQLAETKNEIYKQLQEGTYQQNKTEIIETKQQKQATKTNNKMSAIYVILLFLIAIGGVVYLALQNKKLQEKIEEMNEENIEMYSRLDNRLDIYTPLNEHKGILLKINFLNEQITAISQEINTLKSRNQYKISPHELHAQRTEHLEKVNSLPEVQVYYAKWQETIDAFDPQYFITEPTSQHIFKIEINLNYPKQAMFRIVERSEFQQYILQNTQVLKKVCIFANEPNNDLRIVNIDNGLLEKKNNVWIIIKKLKISFEK